MFLSPSYRLGTLIATGRTGLQRRASWQWQPTRSAHDPNPPITLIEPLTASFAAGLTPTGALATATGGNSISVAGGMTPAGAVARLQNKQTAGGATLAGALGKRTDKTLRGDL